MRMANKPRGNKRLLPWLSANCDNKEGRFIQLGNSLMLNKRYQKLTPGARLFYQCLCMESGGQKTVKFTRGNAKKYGISKSSYDRHTKELMDNGFLEQVMSEDRLQFAPNVFCFSLSWKLKPAPHFGEPHP